MNPSVAYESSPIGGDTSLVLSNGRAVKVGSIDEASCMVLLKDGSIAHHGATIRKTAVSPELFQLKFASGTELFLSDRSRVLMGNEEPAGVRDLSIGSFALPIMVNDDRQLETPFGGHSDEIFDYNPLSVNSKRFSDTRLRLINSKMVSINPSIVNYFSAHASGRPRRIDSWVDMTRLAKSGAIDFVVEVKSIGDGDAYRVTRPKDSYLIAGQDKGQVFSLIS